MRLPQTSILYDAARKASDFQARTMVALHVLESAKKDLWLAILGDTNLGEPIASLAMAFQNDHLPNRARNKDVARMRALQYAVALAKAEVQYQHWDKRDATNL